MKWFIPIIFVLLHSIWVLYIASIVGCKYTGPGYQQELQTWVLVALPDMPAAVIVGLFSGNWLYAYTSPSFANVVFPALMFLVFGGLQWGVVGWGLGWLIEKLQPPVADPPPPGR